MKRASFLTAAAAVGLATTVVPAAAKPGEPVRVILVGDSTMATASGYGDALCAELRRQAVCLNLAKGGRSSMSYRAEGSWAKVAGLLADGRGYRATYVLVQFGHNDQPGKPGRSTDLATEFPVNMGRYVDEIRAAGAVPVLVTPLTRRQFRDGRVIDSLGPWAEATLGVARVKGVKVLDLHTDSLAAVQKMGPTEANTLAAAPPPDFVAEAARTGTTVEAPKPAPVVPADNVVERAGPAAPVFDYTHLGPKGAALFARMVRGELIRAVPALQPWFRQSVPTAGSSRR